MHYVNQILKGLKDSDASLCRMYGECLGVLGAIDPGRSDSCTDTLSHGIII